MTISDKCFGPGAVVRMNCGGPAMVISRGLPCAEWLCHWHQDDWSIGQASIPQVALHISEPDVWPRDWPPEKEPT